MATLTALHPAPGTRLRMAGPGLDPRALVRPAAAYTVVVPARHRERITSVRHGARPTAVFVELNRSRIQATAVR